MLWVFPVAWKNYLAPWTFFPAQFPPPNLHTTLTLNLHTQLQWSRWSHHLCQPIGAAGPGIAWERWPCCEAGAKQCSSAMPYNTKCLSWFLKIAISNAGCQMSMPRCPSPAAGSLHSRTAGCQVSRPRSLSPAADSLHSRIAGCHVSRPGRLPPSLPPSLYPPRYGCSSACEITCFL